MQTRGKLFDKAAEMERYREGMANLINKVSWALICRCPFLLATRVSELLIGKAPRSFSRLIPRVSLSPFEFY